MHLIEDLVSGTVNGPAVRPPPFPRLASAAICMCRGCFAQRALTYRDVGEIVSSSSPIPLRRCVACHAYVVPCRAQIMCILHCFAWRIAQTKAYVCGGELLCVCVRVCAWLNGSLAHVARHSRMCINSISSTQHGLILYVIHSQRAPLLFFHISSLHEQWQLCAALTSL